MAVSAGAIRLRGSCVQCARQMGQVTPPCRTFEEMQVKWKECEHWAVNIAWPGLVAEL